MVKLTTIFDGMRVIVKDKPYDLNEDSTRWSVGGVIMVLLMMFLGFILRFEIQFEGNIGDSVNVDPNGKDVPFDKKYNTQ